MSEITALPPGKSREKRVRVFLDGKFAFTLNAGAAVQEGLRVGQELSDGRVEELVKAEHFRRCMDAALRYLSFRPRSEAEMRQRLARRGFDKDGVDAVLLKLKGQGLVDDAAFARFWKENRELFSPRSQRLTSLELRRKGVTGEIIDEVAGTVDDSDSAYRAALSRARLLPTTEYGTFRRRLGEYLRRRGFSYEVASHTVERVWRELGAGQTGRATKGDSLTLPVRPVPKNCISNEEREVK